MIKAVLFDVGGTLQTQESSTESDRDYIKMLMAYLRENHIETTDDPQKLLESVDKGWSLYKKYTDAKDAELPNDVVWKDYMLVDYGVPAERLNGLGEALSCMFDRYRKKILPRKGLQETLEQLKNHGYRLGIISNVMSTTFVPQILEEHQISQYFEYVLLSSVCGVRKPDKRIFDIALEHMKLEKSEMCYVGDTVSRDVRGVVAAGWEIMIQIDNPRTYHRDEQFRGMGFEATYHIKELPEIVPLLDKYREDSKGR